MLKIPFLCLSIFKKISCVCVCVWVLIQYCCKEDQFNVLIGCWNFGPGHLIGCSCNITVLFTVLHGYRNSIVYLFQLNFDFVVPHCGAEHDLYIRTRRVCKCCREYIDVKICIMKSIINHIFSLVFIEWISCSEWINGRYLGNVLIKMGLHRAVLQWLISVLAVDHMRYCHDIRRKRGTLLISVGLQTRS